MFINSGSSSKLVDLNIFPNLVSLSSSGRKLPFPSFLSVIVRNLYNVNIFPLNPGLSCLKITGVPNFILTKIAVIKITGDKTINAIKAQIQSCGRFIYFS